MHKRSPYLYSTPLKSFHAGVTGGNKIFTTFLHFVRDQQKQKRTPPSSPQKNRRKRKYYRNYIADLRQEDLAYFYASLLEGHCIEGIIQTIDGQSFSLLCNQPIIRKAREGDSLSLRINPQAQFRVLGSEWTKQGYMISLRKTFGRPNCTPNQKISLHPASMGWNFVQRQRRKSQKECTTLDGFTQWRTHEPYTPNDSSRTSVSGPWSPRLRKIKSCHRNRHRSIPETAKSHHSHHQ